MLALTDLLYEPKLIYYSAARRQCVPSACPYGEVVTGGPATS
jgi:hypothetical protein